MNIVILGATSSLARAMAVEFAQQNAQLYLASRDLFELNRIATDLSLRFSITAHCGEFDAENFASHEKFWQQVLTTMGSVDGVVIAFGYMPPPLEKNQFQKIINSNFSGVVSILNYISDYLKQQKQGFIIGISSVAGERGRYANYLYGSSKAALTTYLSGLRNELFRHGVHVMTVKPGFIDTAMTFGRPNLFLVATPEKTAKSIIKALNKKRNMIYVPWFWRYIMIIFKLIPESLFKRMNL